MEKTLTEYRNEIDEIDEQITALFCRRMKLCGEIGEWKKEHGMQVLDSAREEEKSECVSSLAGEPFAPYARKLFATVMECSRAYQNEKNGENT